MNNLLYHIRNYLQNDLIYIVILSLSTIVVSYFFAISIRWFAKVLIVPLFKKTKNTLDDQIIDIVASSVYKLLLLCGFYAATKIMREGYGLYSARSQKTLISEYPVFDDITKGFEHILFFIFLIVLLSVSYRIVVVLLDWYSEKINASENKNLSGSLFPLLKKVSKILLTVTAFTIALAKFNIDISAFVLSLGVGSLALALAAQDTLSNMISGFIIMTDRPFRIGDRIKIGTNLIGDVLEIGIRSTKILDFDRNIIIVPNNDIVKSQIINQSYPSNVMRALVTVSVAYGSDIEKVKNVMIEAAKLHPKVSEEVEPVVAFMNFGDSSLEFRLDVKTDFYNDAFMLASDLREIIHKKFKENNIEIPLPQRVIHVKN